MTPYREQSRWSAGDTGERRRASDPRPVIGDLIDEATIEAIAPAGSDVIDAPAVGNPADLVGVDVLWRGEPVVISVQGARPALPGFHPQHENEVFL